MKYFKGENGSLDQGCWQQKMERGGWFGDGDGDVIHRDGQPQERTIFGKKLS